MPSDFMKFLREDFRDHLLSIQEGNPLARVDTLSKEGRHFVGISAERTHLTPEENKSRMAQIKKDVSAMGYGFRPSRGMWEGGGEASIVVHARDGNHEHPKEFMKKMKSLGHKYDQDSIFYHNGKTGHQIGTNETGWPGKGVVKSVGKVAYNKPDAEFQTAFNPKKPEAMRPKFTTVKE